ATWRGAEREKFSRVKPMGKDDETLNDLLAQARVCRNTPLWPALTGLSNGVMPPKSFCFNRKDRGDRKETTSWILLI
ncbi:MAG: hypothetical protein ACPGVU_20335, partial [Limisphaerales bacterium]